LVVGSRKYDAAGNKTTVTDASGNVTTFAYDADNRLIRQTDPLGHAATFAYDGVGLVTATTDRDGRLSTFQYDALNRVTGQTWYSDNSALATHITQILTTSYDAAGNQLTAADGAGTYTMMYDAVNRVTVAQEMQGLALTFSYDAVRNRTQVQYGALGQVLPPTIETSTYDAANALVTRVVAGANGFYDCGGEMEVDLSYQANGFLKGVVRSSLAQDLPVTYPQAAGSTSYSYDGTGHIYAVVDYDASGNVLANYSYLHFSPDQLSREFDNGVVSDNSYDGTNQLLEAHHGAYAAPPTDQSSTTYQYDATGNRTAVVSNNGGTVTSQSYSTGAGNEMTSDGTYTYKYDAEGNIIEKATIGGGVAWTYSYDNQNHMVAAREYSSVSLATLVTEADYSYDYFGNCVVENSTDAENEYFFDGWNPALAKAVGNSKWVMWGELSDGVFSQSLHGDGVSQWFGQLSSDEWWPEWFLTDQLGSVVGETNDYGALGVTVAYDAFGNVTGTTYLDSSTMPEYSWAGQRLDAATGLYQMGARFYDPTTGRWTTQDPLGLQAGDSNLYRYVNNNPLDAVDPSGLQTPLGIPGTPGNPTINSAEALKSYYSPIPPIPTNATDRSGLQQNDTIEMSRIIPPGVKALDPKAAGNQNDLYINIQFLKKEQTLKYYYIGEDGKETSDTTSTSQLSSTFSKGDVRQFNEIVPVIVTLKSRSGQEVRGLHLQQDVLSSWTQSDEETINRKIVKKDYSSVTDKDNLTYGGWWFWDAVTYQNTSPARQGFGKVFNRMFWQARVFVEENPKIQMYWGFYIRADFGKKGADVNAIVERKTFGPQQTLTLNPFLGKKE